MKDWLDFIQKLDLNNGITIIVIAVGIVVFVTKCVFDANASSIEMIFMDKKSEINRIIYLYIGLFAALVFLNLVFTVGNLKIPFLMPIWFIVLIAYIVVTIIKLFKKNVFSKCEEILGIMLFFLFYLEIMYILTQRLNFKLSKIVIIVSSSEIIFFILNYLNPRRTTTKYYINIENEKWYVFRRVDGGFILCGNQSCIDYATKFKLVSLDVIVKKEICLE